jgi:hypothetical protein
MLAKLKNIKNPNISVAVVKNIDDDNAGSICILSNTNGIINPAMPATIKLPIIAIRRTPTVNILNPNKKPTTYDGLKIPELSKEDKMVKLSMIPIEISYQLDIYCRYMREADVLARSLVFNIINHPTLEVLIPYDNINLEHNANIRLTAGIEDNSDIPERFVPGQFTRLSLTINIDDAYLWDARERDNLIVDIKEIDVDDEN